MANRKERIEHSLSPGLREVRVDDREFGGGNERDKQGFSVHGRPHQFSDSITTR